MVNLKVIRKFCNDVCSIGDLYLNDTLFCYTLEPVDRNLTQGMSLDEIKSIKVDGKTAIPTGFYSVTLYNSPKHNTIVPLVNKVTGFEGIEIHIGNFPKDTEGCILVGSGKGLDKITSSKNAFNMLMEQLNKADKITLEIWKLHAIKNTRILKA